MSSSSSGLGLGTSAPVPVLPWRMGRYVKIKDSFDNTDPQTGQTTTTELDRKFYHCRTSQKCNKHFGVVVYSILLDKHNPDQSDFIISKEYEGKQIAEKFNFYALDLSNTVKPTTKDTDYPEALMRELWCMMILQGFIDQYDHGLGDLNNFLIVNKN